MLLDRTLQFVHMLALLSLPLSLYLGPPPAADEPPKHTRADNDERRTGGRRRAEVEREREGEDRQHVDYGRTAMLESTLWRCVRRGGEPT